MVIYDEEKKMLYIPSAGDKVIWDDYEEKKSEAYRRGYEDGFKRGAADARAECEMDFSRKYFTIKLLDNTDVPFYGNQDGPFYRINDGEWFVNEASGGAPTVIALKNGDRIEMKHDRRIQITYLDFPCKIYGNVMSILYGDDFHQHTDVPGGAQAEYFSLMGMFAGSTGIVDASNLAIPSGEIGDNGCDSMFQDCTSLVVAPELPATAVGEWGYYSMFAGCTSLTTAPELPATTLGKTCYHSMFSGCTSLTTAPSVLPATSLTRGDYCQMFLECTSLTASPELPAATLVDICYKEMFAGCTSLSSVKCLATNISARGCTDGWLRDVAQTGTFTKSPDMSDWTTGESGIPVGWVVNNG